MGVQRTLLRGDVLSHAGQCGVQTPPASVQIDCAVAEDGAYERSTVATVVPALTTQLPARPATGHGEGEYSDGPERTLVVQTDGAFAAV